MINVYISSRYHNKSRTSSSFQETQLWYVCLTLFALKKHYSAKLLTTPLMWCIKPVSLMIFVDKQMKLSSTVTSGGLKTNSS